MFISDVSMQLGRKLCSYRMFSGNLVGNNIHFKCFQALWFSHWIVPGRKQTTIASSMEDILLRFESFSMSRETILQIQKSNARPKLQIDSLRENFCLTLHANTLVVKSNSDVFNKRICKTSFPGVQRGLLARCKWHCRGGYYTHTQVNPIFNPHNRCAETGGWERSCQWGLHLLPALDLLGERRALVRARQMSLHRRRSGGGETKPFWDVERCHLLPQIQVHLWAHCSSSNVSIGGMIIKSSSLHT